MESETEYDPESGVEVEVCSTCEELTDYYRAQVAVLRRFDDPETWHGAFDHDQQRKRLTDARDTALRALEAHQREHESASDS